MGKREGEVGGERRRGEGCKKAGERGREGGKERGDKTTIVFCFQAIATAHLHTSLFSCYYCANYLHTQRAHQSVHTSHHSDT